MTAPPAQAALGGPSDPAAWSLRMRDLCEATGLDRQTIHFYIREGLLPPGRKTGRNMAYYGQEHLERLRLIRRLQHERFLPLAAIKAVLDGSDDRFDDEQMGWLRALKRHVSTSLARGADAPELRPVAPLLAACGISAEELRALEAMGVLAVGRDATGAPAIAAEDTWILETVGELRALGFTAERGFGVEVIALYEQTVSALFEREKDLVKATLTRLDVGEAARMTERVLPLVHRFLTRYHEAMIRRFFAAME